MLGSVHLADVDLRGRWAALTSTRPAGARYVSKVVAAQLTGAPMARPAFGRIGLIAFWENEDALEGFLATHPLADVLASGWRVRLAPVRASGAWSGLPTDLPHGRDTDTDGPAAVLTLGRVRLTQLIRFRKASAAAEARLAGAAGLVWATGLARPPLVSTFSLWRSVAALTDYAYRDHAHAEVIRADRARPFHHRSAFIRFRPYRSEGQLDGGNPLPADWTAEATR